MEQSIIEKLIILSPLLGSFLIIFCAIAYHSVISILWQNKYFRGGYFKFSMGATEAEQL